jgi:electron transfer flavoprotein alpha subunit
MGGGVMVFAEQENGKIHGVSYELLGKGSEIADKLGVELSCVLLGFRMEKEAEELIYHGADKVFLFDHSSLEEFDVIRYKQNIVNLVRREKPEIFLIGATHLGRSLAPRVAASLETGLTADCIDLKVDERGNLIQIRPAFSGTILAHIITRTRPQMSTVRYKVMRRMERDPTRKGKILREEVQVLERSGLRIIGKEKAGGVNITEAEVVVSGGRGLKKPDDFSLLKELADLLGGVVGSSRPLVDEGWIGREHQVGFSGNTVKPRLYIACGISGSPQHLAGMRDSDVIVAINTDPSAPIFRVADYCIVGDLYEVVPKLIEEVKRRRPRWKMS